ncbi:hypothetical protein CBG25_00310 [Arsenophonus sp. ENCA]|uniref:plasmid partitioning/stability family protein n=1 Tax=Arsenophonus sp. ENCA TaxID=1987579 RepID=UPI000BD6A9ED|nr:plasmid partitioning/stability family protein [Arsenophonus sp. ENCA]PAV11584.1 hypothetical protein CBG25_00310 [Arsenophonus sp. ENCA]
MTDNSRKKIVLYVYPDEASQRTALDKIESLPVRQRPDFQRDCLIAGVCLAKVDPRLPRLLATAITQDIGFATVQNVLNVIRPIDNTLSDQVVAVAWQKRERNTLSPNNEWLDWFPISESQYNASIAEPSDNAEVRVLWARQEGEKQIIEGSVKHYEVIPKTQHAEQREATITAADKSSADNSDSNARNEAVSNAHDIFMTDN